jgi:hypothetical protein
MIQKRINPNFRPRQLLVASGVLNDGAIATALSGLLNGRLLKDFKPRRLTPAQRQALRQLGVGRERPFLVRPDHIPKMVLDDQCDLCGQVLPDGTVQCLRCGNCVYCGAYNPDHYANTCLMCGNDAPGRTDETDVVVNIDPVR